MRVPHLSAQVMLKPVVRVTREQRPAAQPLSLSPDPSTPSTPL